VPISTLKDALEYYRNYAGAIENRADDTIRFKETPVRQLIGYLGYAPSLEEINKRLVVDFFAWLRERPKWKDHPSGNRPQGRITDIATNTYFRGLRALFNWLVTHGIIEKSLLANVEEPEYIKKLPRHLKFDDSWVSRYLL
jgi:site-specific recombinase XerD